MKLTTAVIPIINTLLIDILIEATASISGILSYFHSKFSILLRKNQTSNADQFYIMSLFNSGILWPGYSDKSKGDMTTLQLFENFDDFEMCYWIWKKTGSEQSSFK